MGGSGFMVLGCFKEDIGRRVGDVRGVAGCDELEWVHAGGYTEESEGEAWSSGLVRT